MKRLSVVIALACCTLSWGAEPADYLPLQVGNQWVLQTNSSTPDLLIIEVLRSRIINDQIYYLVSGYAPGDRWIRRATDGTIHQFDERLGADDKLAELTIGTGGFRTDLGGCEQIAQPAGAPASYRGPHFRADDALSVQYTSESCTDAGLTSETYAPSVGLLHRSLSTIRGETRFDLFYARVNGSAILGASRELVISSDFNSGSKGWLPGFSDYSLQTSDLRMLAEPRPLPDEISNTRSGFYIQSMNRSDDIFMYLKKSLTTEDGLEPNRAYRVSFDIQFASNARSGCVGVGGAPGEAVYLKAGASANEPVAFVDTSGDIRLNVDKGQQSLGGRDAGIVGTIANGVPCGNSQPWYVPVRKTYAHPETLHTDDRGSLWLFVGTDSAFEGLTGLYFASITVRINPAAEVADAFPTQGGLR